MPSPTTPDWFSFSTPELGGPPPQPKSKSPQHKLNICGVTGHEAYTIPIRHGRAQCLGCHVVRSVDAKYTPNFKKSPFPIPSGNDHTEEQTAPTEDQTVDLDEFDEEDPNAGEFEEDEPE